MDPLSTPPVKSGKVKRLKMAAPNKSAGEQAVAETAFIRNESRTNGQALYPTELPGIATRAGLEPATASSSAK